MLLSPEGAFQRGPGRIIIIIIIIINETKLITFSGKKKCRIFKQHEPYAKSATTPVHVSPAFLDTDSHCNTTLYSTDCFLPADHFPYLSPFSSNSRHNCSSPCHNLSQPPFVAHGQSCANASDTVPRAVVQHFHHARSPSIRCPSDSEFYP